jgi:carboxypeptidase Q
MSSRLAAVIGVSLALSAVPAAQQSASAPEKIDYSAIAQIRDEGLNRSQVMDHIGWLSDVYGPRLTGGPEIMQASEWAIRKFNEWGLANPHRETWQFGRGWTLVRFSAHMIEPQIQPLIGYPASWTPGTAGTVTADVVRVQIDTESDLERYRGKLAGKIVLTQPERAVTMLDGTIVHRMTDKDFEEAATTPIPRARGGGPAAAAGGGGGRGGQNLAQRIQQFYKAEGVVALFNRGGDNVNASIGSDLSVQQQRTDGGTVFPSGGGSRTSDPGTQLPTVTLAVEHYNRMVRVLGRGVPVKVELNIQTQFHEETAPNGFNLVAEIPGVDPVLKDEVVLLGAHFDSVAAATGATDNATGSAAMMEAMRILKAIGAKPRRTIRIVLWGGEEEGLLGSRAYVREHYADVATMALKPAHGKVSAYFNSDNGTGRVRGVWLQGNLAVRPIFEQWIQPLSDLGVVALGPRSVGSTDHASFDNVGIPGFQFMVDRLEYNSRTHHSNMDFYDRVQRDDMIQQATVVAVFAYNAAMRDEKLPRKPLPKPQPARTDSQ